MLKPDVYDIFNEPICNQTIEKIDKVNKTNAKDVIKEKDVFDKQKSSKKKEKSKK